jgi:hypothetical protein
VFSGRVGLLNQNLPCEGESRGFAFVKFFAVEQAMEYMDKHFPVVQFGEMKVKIAYSLGRGEEDNGWTCDKVSYNYLCDIWTES